MARKQPTGEIRAWWVTTITPTAPTAAQINAGVNVTVDLKRSGLKTPRSANAVDASTVSSMDNLQSVGTKNNGPYVVNGLRDSVTGTEVAYNALAEDAVGYLVVRRFGGSTTTAAAGNVVEVYPGTVAVRAEDDIAENENYAFTAEIMATSPPTRNVTVV
jgi:hypothetical protein